MSAIPTCEVTFEAFEATFPQVLRARGYCLHFPDQMSMVLDHEKRWFRVVAVSPGTRTSLQLTVVPFDLPNDYFFVPLNNSAAYQRFGELNANARELWAWWEAAKGAVDMDPEPEPERLA